MSDHMTVRDLIAALSKMDPDRIVIIQKDAEGNGYSPLRAEGVDDNAVYAAETTWYGEVGIQTLTPHLKSFGYSEMDVGAGVPCVVLVPVN